MNTYIALFRGINVGGNHSLPMKELAAILAELGADHIQTYIQSGNAVFHSAASDAGLLSQQISAAVNQRCGFAPEVLVLTRADFEQALADNPFPEPESDPRILHLGFLASPPAQVNFEKIDSLKAASEQYHLTERVFYLNAPEGVGRSRLAVAIERILGVPMTDRNWRTVCKLRDLATQ